MAGDNINVTPGTGATVAADSVTYGGASALAQAVKILDGTAGSVNPLTVKAASTPPVATDPAVVVSISPNSPMSPPYAPTPLGYQQIASSTTLQSLTVPGTATFALIEADGGAARWRDDGTNPTASVGMPLASGVPTWFYGDLSVLKLIAQSAAVTYNVSYYK